MKIVEPKVYVVRERPEGKDDLKLLERIARVPYASEGNITEDSYEGFLGRIVGNDHTAMVEFGNLTFIVRCDRGVTHELVRHRLASFAQESTRYCNYSGKKYEREITVIRPFFLEGTDLTIWKRTIETAEIGYLDLLDAGRKPQEARSVLPNSTKAMIAIRMNFRELRTFFGLRCAKDAHPQMRQVAIPLFRYCLGRWPVLFNDLPKWGLATERSNPGELIESDLAEVEELDALDLASWPGVL